MEPVPGKTVEVECPCGYTFECRVYSHEPVEVVAIHDVGSLHSVRVLPAKENKS